MSATQHEQMLKLVKYEQDEAALVALAEQSRGLRVDGVNDKAGLERVREARLKLRGCRTEIERQREALKRSSLEFGRKVDEEARRLTALVEPTERVLKAEEERIAKEVARLRQEKIQERASLLDQYGVRMSDDVLADMGVDDFQRCLEGARASWEKAEADRLEREQIAREEAERAAQEEAARRHALAQEEQRLAAERKRLDDERAAFEAEKAKSAPPPPPPAQSRDVVDSQVPPAYSAPSIWSPSQIDAAERIEKFVMAVASQSRPGRYYVLCDQLRRVAHLFARSGQ